MGPESFGHNGYTGTSLAVESAEWPGMSSCRPIGYILPEKTTPFSVCGIWFTIWLPPPIHPEGKNKFFSLFYDRTRILGYNKKDDL